MVMDTIGNYLTLIRNACNVKKSYVKVNYSKINKNITKVLYKNNYIKKYKIYKINKINKIKIYLKYINNNSVIIKIKRISKPSLRKYLKYKNIYKVLNGYGISIISTSMGVMTGKEAKLKKIGGEILCIIY
ncbi:30S ribosomal protein S8 [Candidatus Shikimatogenerans bostrichidophilus]|uniref:30S ribosomal protein S8 n=1 Tax=Candidatus Shikimatogenerans bostrichidophilus TaxID=2943807 RepID=UPI002966218A